MDEDQNPIETEPAEYTEDLSDEPMEETEDEAQAVEEAVETPVAETPAPVVAPSVNFRSAADAEQFLKDNVDESTVNALMTVIEARYSNARQAEGVADFYAGQIEQAAPGFLGANERAILRQMNPAQQADPAAVMMAALSSAMQKAQTTKDVTGALDEFVDQWQKKRGRAQSEPPAALPPSQRMGGGGGGATPQAVRTVRRERNATPADTVSALFGEGADAYMPKTTRR